jgi:hypothetical protein
MPSPASVYGRGAWRYHSLRARRGSGVMAEDTTRHVLLCAWQVANAAGFCWQVVAEVLSNRRSAA